MQALYRDEIAWGDVPDHEPPFETDHWQEYLIQKELLSLHQSVRAISRSVPSSPVCRTSVGTRSVPSSPLHRAEPWSLPLKLTLPTTESTPIPPPATPVYQPIPKRHPSLLDAIREVDSASHTPERTRTPSPPPMKLPRGLKTGLMKTEIPPLIETPVELKGAWKERQLMKTMIEAAPVLSSAVPPQKTVFLRALHKDTTIREIVAATASLGTLRSFTCVIHPRDTVQTHLCFKSLSNAQSAVERGITIKDQFHHVEYSRREMDPLSSK
jgi:hypothetical protein